MGRPKLYPMSREDARELLTALTEDKLRDIYLKLQKRYGNTYAPPHEMRNRQEVEDRLLDSLRMTGDSILLLRNSNQTFHTGRMSLIRFGLYQDGILTSEWLDLCHEAGSRRDVAYDQLFDDRKLKYVEMIYV